jgi:DNA repair photolyase
LSPIRKGRAAAANPKNRFERIETDYNPEHLHDPDAPAERTQFFRDTSRSIVASNDSPDVGFDVSINPYRGCEHGCIYCYARPTHEYLGYSLGLDFETRILVKEDAPELLSQTLSRPGWVPKPMAISGVTDPYQPVERRLRLTRKCLEVLADFRNPAIIITKNHLVTRDIDVLRRLAEHEAILVNISVTTLDPSLARVMEPRTSTPQRRIDAIAELTKAGIPTGVLVAPVIPGLTDHEMPSIIEACVSAGATHAGYVTIRLPHGVKTLFDRWLEDHRPEHRDKVLARIRAVRDGALDDPSFGVRMRGTGPIADQIQALYQLACRRAGIDRHRPALSTDGFRRPSDRQMSLFD